MTIREQPKPTFTPLGRPGCQGVSFRVLLNSEGLALCGLRFETGATIDRHSAPFEIDVICIDGSGYTSIGDEIFEIASGESVRWPTDEEHCLWTTNETLETLMIERHNQPGPEATSSGVTQVSVET